MFQSVINKLLVPIHFLKTALSEQDGLASTSRITAFLTTIATLSWITFVVIHSGSLPDLTSASYFLAAGHGGYVANKVSDLIKGE